MIELGIRGRKTEIVTCDNTAESMGSGDMPVYATPAMIALMEETAAVSVKQFLDPGTTTVGTLVNIKHLSATPIGMAVTCDSVLEETDGRRLTFSVTVSDDSGIVGEGLHERFIVGIDRFLEKAGSKLK